MGSALALVRAGWLTSTSYRLRTLFSFAGLAASVVPVYFVAGALQPTMQDVLRSEGESYFGFVVIGLAALTALSPAVQALPSAIAADIRSGTLEALLATPARLRSLLAGMVGLPLIWAGLKVALLVGTAALLGAELHWGRIGFFALALALTLAAYLPLGVLAAAGILVFRTAGPFPQGVVYLSVLLGGVYYPTHVIPTWIEKLSLLVPLTYGLRAMRRALLGDSVFVELLPDLAVLLLFAALFGSISACVLAWALRIARQQGTLSQY